MEFLAVLLIFGLGVFAGWRVTDWRYGRHIDKAVDELNGILDDAALNQYKTPDPKD